MTHLERKTKQELAEIYNDPTPSKMWGTLGDRARSGVAVLAEKEYHLGPKGELRWNSSNNIVPGDILEMAVVDGTIDIAVRNRTEEVREVEDEVFLRTISTSVKNMVTQKKNLWKSMPSLVMMSQLTSLLVVKLEQESLYYNDSRRTKNY